MTTPSDLLKMSLFDIAKEQRRMRIASTEKIAEPEYTKITELELADLLTGLGGNELYGVDIRSQLLKGIEVEVKEHGRYGPKHGEFNLVGVDEYKAAKIAAAHIAEIPDYYDRLEAMETAGKAYWKEQGVDLDD